ncbi:cobalamin biosynthesis protein CbiX [Mumia sp. ZJ1417]|uniref:sirohydrochlorin chelatase n=1 Tax=Mumia sp. ZJ1417 TaxID=2708082 RepID=UPI001420C94E|nr:cobalamin biosynthesis protein CbiX [Mumia sp. ZJ1417]QMW66084.1 cobalamin biosynthesis protein CbiX [Mumia sp. ZJ1417]
MPTGEHGAVTTVLVGGHESAQGSDLVSLLDALPGAVVTPPGRALRDAVTTHLAADEARVAVLPMTWGRDPVMVADAAKTLSWIAASAGAGRVALCPSFGTIDHMVAWLRRAATETARQCHGSGMLVTAPSSNPFDDAELHRIAHLVRTHGAGVQVEVACVAATADLAHAVDRARLLGSDDVVVVPAGFARTAPAGLPSEHATFFGPLLSERAVLDVIRRRVGAAQHDLSHGLDGIAAGLLADHGHGYAHSHAFEVDAGGHSHPHPRHHAPYETSAERGASHDEVLTSPH